MSLFLLFSFRDMIFLGIPMLVSLLYVQPFNKIKSSLPDLRSIPGMKVIWVGLIWMWATVLFPVFHHSISLTNPEVIIWSLTQLLFIIGITIPFDIRDLTFDPASYQTIPQVFGIRGAKIIANALIGLAFLGWTYLFSQAKINIYSLATQLILIVGTMMVVKKTKQDHPELYFTGLIDGLIIGSGILLILTECYVQ